MTALEAREFIPQEIKFWKDSWERLYMEAEGKVWGPVKVQRAFPLTASDAMLIVQDDEGRYLGMIQEYKTMDEASLVVLEEELEREYFLPKITKIHEIEDDLRLLTWHVETDRGPRVFEVQNRRADIQWFTDTHVVIQDADGNKYEISDLSKLDPASRQKVEMEV
ncbi:MAG: DUF1854 domain-containing protein [Firmicutes bacterium]|nr:DUF1854 domain-containing protein [Bacillota bacterium]